MEVDQPPTMPPPAAAEKPPVTSDERSTKQIFYDQVISEYEAAFTMTATIQERKKELLSLLQRYFGDRWSFIGFYDVVLLQPKTCISEWTDKLAEMPSDMIPRKPSYLYFP